jgi:carbonic anhydrase/acetyltransferase-like protein (isoleucine patch superfamily)
MLIANNKPIRVIGFPESAMTQEMYYFISEEFAGESKIILPDDFLSLSNIDDYQYFVGFSLDIFVRAQIIDLIEQKNLDCVSYVHDTVVYYNKDVKSWLGQGSWIGPFSTILINAKIGKHCIIEPHCLIAHYSEIKDNVILHVGTLIAGKTTVGENSVWNFKSTALNALDICGGIEVGATSTITKNIKQPGHYVGTPARRVGDRKIFDGI